jgi:GGDEF domain-containing protein
VLRLIASLLSERTGPEDVVGRWAGDTFLLILAGTTATQAGLFAEELRAALAEAPYVTAAGEQVPIRASFGIAAYPQDAPDASGLAAAADADLRASRRGEDVAADDEQAASGPLAEPSAEESSADESAGESPAETAAVETAAGERVAPKVALRNDGAIDQAEMRSRIEATRTRLKVKAFDAMIRGQVALLGRDDGEAPGPAAEDPTLDGDLEGMVDGAFSEQEY